MSQTIKLKNFDSPNIVAQTVLDGDLAANVASLPVQNSGDFVAGTVLIGSIGGETSELATVTSAPDATHVAVSPNTKLPHNNAEPVYMLFGNQLRIYSAADVAGTGEAPDDSAFTLLTTVSIDGNNALTSYTDGTNPAATTWYKVTYYNSVSHAETPLAEAVAFQGDQSEDHYVSLDQIRRAAGFINSPNVTDDIVREHRNAAEKEINGALLPVYDFPLPKPTNPIIIQIAKDLAAGELKAEMYQGVSESLVKSGRDMAEKARHGGGHHTSLDELVMREVVLEDAKFTELTVDEGHGFGGYPDASTPTADSADGTGFGPQFTIDQEY